MFSMHKGESRTLTGNDTTAEFQRNTFKVNKHTKAIAARFKVRLNLTKSGGDAALTAAQVRTLLSCFDLTLTYGYGQQHTPFSKVDWNKLRNLTRYGLGSQWEGYSDSATGLTRTIASSATAVTFYVRVPFTALGWQDPAFTQYWGVGPTQARTMSFTFRQNTVSLPAGFAVAGNITIDSMGADEVPAPEDTWSYLPTYRELSETNRVAERMTKGLPALIFERTAVHASTTMTECELRIREYSAYKNVTLAEVVTRYRDPQASFPSEADLTDEYTLLWAVPPGTLVQFLPTGKPVFEQVTQNLATLALSTWTYEPVSQGAIEADLREVADLVGRRVFVVSAYQAGGKKMPKTHQFCGPLHIYTDGDKEVDSFASLLAAPGTDAVVVNVGPTLEDDAKFRYARLRGNNQFVKAEDVIQQVALSVPGAGTPEGLAMGSRYLDTVRGKLT